MSAFTLETARFSGFIGREFCLPAPYTLTAMEVKYVIVELIAGGRFFETRTPWGVKN